MLSWEGKEAVTDLAVSDFDHFRVALSDYGCTFTLISPNITVMFSAIHFRHFFSVLSLILVLLVTQTSGYSYVWCFGDNGHSALEQAHGGCHADHADHAQQHPDHALQYTSADHCGPCLDLLPTSSYAANRLRDELLVHHYQALSIPDDTLLTQLVAAATPSSVPIPALSPRIREQILLHRTVVLLH